MYLPVNGPVAYGAVSVSTSATELKVGASALDERKVIMIQAQGSSIYIGFDNAVTTSTGMELRKRQTITLEAGSEMTVYAIADSGTIDVRIWELG